VLGKDRAFFDALEYLLGFLAIRGRGIAHEGDGIMHPGGFASHFFAALISSAPMASISRAAAS
jgi:hypothetical protein